MITRSLTRSAALLVAGALSLAALDQPATGTPANDATLRSFTVVATGDPLLHEAWWAQARIDARRTGRGEMDFIPALSSTAAITRGADLAVCHLETVLAEEGGPYRGYPSFNSPPQIVAAMKDQGYDICTTASNHTFDQGTAGIKRTLDDLDAAGIPHVGSARTRAEAERPVITEVRTDRGIVRVGHLAYTYGFNGVPFPHGDRWRGNLISVPRILAAARRAKLAGAEVVILTMHWGTEYSQSANAEQKAQARQLLASPNIDLIIGGHAHVVQPIERINGKWVTYGHGNLFGCHQTPGAAREEGLLSRFTFTEKPGGGFTATDAEYLPLLGTCSRTRAKPYRVMNIPMALRTGDYGVYGRDRLTTAFNRTRRVVLSLGAGQDGLHLLAQ